jgi:hypothetical protein
VGGLDVGLRIAVLIKGWLATTGVWLVNLVCACNFWYAADVDGRFLTGAAGITQLLISKVSKRDKTFILGCLQVMPALE